MSRKRRGRRQGLVKTQTALSQPTIRQATNASVTVPTVTTVTTLSTD